MPKTKMTITLSLDDLCQKNFKIKTILVFSVTEAFKTGIIIRRFVIDRSINTFI